MAAVTRVPRTSQSLQCLCSSTVTPQSIFSRPYLTQWRGKKKKAKLPPTLMVKLLQDMDGYGRKGFIVPVAPGRMRNKWYPSGCADYVTTAQLREMKELVVERDHAFGARAETSKGESESEPPEETTDVEVKLLSPQRATQLLEQLLPPQIEFYRTPIATTATTPAKSSLEGNASSSYRTEVGPTAIFGSVTTADILAGVKAFLTLSAKAPGTEDAVKVVLGSEDISILQGEERTAGQAGEADRIKALGVWEFEIQVKGGTVVRRRVAVLPQAPQD